jgi:hypothetical protein
MQAYVWILLFYLGVVQQRTLFRSEF